MHLDLEKYEPLYIGITKAGAWKLCVGPRRGVGRWIVAVRRSCRRTAACTDCLSCSRDDTRRSVWMSCFRSSTANSARTGRYRAFWSFPAFPTSVATSKVRLCAWTSLSRMLVAESAGIATPKYWTVGAEQDIDPDGITYPVFVKPARSGSSFGVSKVSREQELLGAVEVARQYDSKVLIEEAVAGSRSRAARFSGMTWT